MCTFPGRNLFGSTGSLRPVAELDAPRTVAARRRFFGDDAVDGKTGAVRADRVVLSWVGCTTYALALCGSVFLLDAWVPTLTSVGYVPATAQDLADLRPEAIFIGHGHFDHAADAGRIAQACGAVVYGTAEHGTNIRAQVADSSLTTVALGDATAKPGARHDFRVGAVEVTAIRHLHSAPTRRSPDGSARFFPLPDPRPVFRRPPTLDALRHNLARLTDAEGGSLLYQFRVPGFALVWHDSSGPLTERAPEVLEILSGLPDTTVHIGAVQGFNQISNGLRDPRRYIEAIAPAVFIPAHHDNWLPGITAPAAGYDSPLHAEFARIPSGARPELRLMHDPTDYLNPGRSTFEL
ncbi:MULTISPECIES: MBL fold metallo-hydrolase [unclassified Nocardia]|uniref:MBL fold metallo-hydrolase n=1 Tax=unclassified Nocardia TaxID=2637762 RepID=UPI001CE492A6|nr:MULTISPECIES: MBL fold metallo-hydrolase [unclassified Nocardia]